MGHILFWLEAAAASALFAAMCLAITRRGRRAIVRWGACMFGFVFLPLFWVAWIALFGFLQIRFGGAEFPLACSALAGGLFVLAAAIVILRGSRRVGPEGRRAAAHWRVGRLAMAWAAALLVTSMTYWNLDLAVRQEMALLRMEAGAIALSVSPPRVPDSQNAAVLYRQAQQMMSARDLADKSPEIAIPTGFGPLDEPPEPPKKLSEKMYTWLNPPKGSFNPDDEQMLAFLRNRGDVITLLRKAGELPAFNLGADYYPPPLTSGLPAVGYLRDEARLLALSARVHAHNGQLDEAMKDLSACFAIAEHVSTEPLVIAVLVSIASEDAAVQALEYAFTQSPPASNDLKNLKFNPLLTYAASMKIGMQMEETLGLSVYSDGPSIRLEDYASDPDIIFVGDLTLPVYGVFLSSNDVSVYRRWVHKYQDILAHPYFESIEKKKALEQESRVGPGAFLAFLITPIYDRAIDVAAMADARHRVAFLAVAMWQYRLAKGSFPQTPDALVPDYLPAVPVDPFDGKSMKLIRTDDGKVVIYSVGEDLKDDGGAPLDKETRSKGDITFTLGG